MDQLYGLDWARLRTHNLYDEFFPPPLSAQWIYAQLSQYRANVHEAAPAMTPQNDRFWQPDVTVATIVVRDGRLLMVEERAEGRLVLNQPAGHLEPDESLQAAALRETLEESAWQVRLTHFVGAYQWKAETGRHYLRFAFAGEPVRHDPALPLDEGIVRAVWMTPGELQQSQARHRSPLVWRVAADYLAGCRYPLSTMNQVP